MAILNFPADPQQDDQYTGSNGTTYIYDGVKWVGRASGTAGTNSIRNSGFVVQVDGDGGLVTPTFTIPNTAGTTGQVLKWPSNGSTLAWSADTSTTSRLVNGLKEAVLNSDGSITLPTLTTLDWDRRNLVGPTLQMGNDPSVNETVITGPAPDQTNPNAVRMIIQGQEGYGPGFGSGQAGGYEGGDVYIWAGHGGEGADYSGNGGDVKLRGGIGGLNGGYIRLESGDANAQNGYGGFLDLNAGNATNTNGRGGDVNIRAGTGPAEDGQVFINGRVTNITSKSTGINTDGGTWNFDSNGSLHSPNGYTLNRGQQQFFTAGDPPTVIYTSQDGTIGAIKAMITVRDAKPNDLNGDYDVDTQVCEMIVTVKRRYTNNGATVTTTPVASVYGVTHTSTLPLATFTVNFVANMSVGPGMTRNVVQILAEPTAAATGNIWVTVAATEMTND